MGLDREGTEATHDDVQAVVDVVLLTDVDFQTALFPKVLDMFRTGAANLLARPVRTCWQGFGVLHFAAQKGSVPALKGFLGCVDAGTQSDQLLLQPCAFHHRTVLYYTAVCSR